MGWGVHPDSAGPGNGASLQFARGSTYCIAPRLLLFAFFFLVVGSCRHTIPCPIGYRMMEARPMLRQRCGGIFAPHRSFSAPKANAFLEVTGPQRSYTAPFNLSSIATACHLKRDSKDHTLGYNSLFKGGIALLHF